MLSTRLPRLLLLAAAGLLIGVAGVAAAGSPATAATSTPAGGGIRPAVLPCYPGGYPEFFNIDNGDSFTLDTVPSTILGIGERFQIALVNFDDGLVLGAGIDTWGDWHAVWTPAEGYWTGTTRYGDSPTNCGTIGHFNFYVGPPAGTPDAVVTAATGSARVDSGSPVTVTGTGQPGAVISVTDSDGSILQTGRVRNDGTYTFTTLTRLADGDHTITVTQTTPAGSSTVATHVTVGATPTPPSPTPPTTPAGAVAPRTGTSPTPVLADSGSGTSMFPLAVTGILLTAGTTLTVVAARRRRAPSTTP